MKIFCHIPRENWFGDRYGAEYLKHSAHNITHTDLNGCNLIWLLADWCWNQIPPQALQSVPVVCTVHHIVPEKFTESEINAFKLRDSIVNAYHVPCDQTRDFISQFTEKPIFKLGYWVDQNLWPVYDKSEMKKLFNLPEDKLIVGSFQRDTEGSDLVSPKLEKGPDRFCDYIENLKDNGYKPHVLLNAWRRQYVINRLEKAEIQYTYIKLPKMDIVAKMYQACDLYVVGSRYEGGPQSIIECGISKVPIISTDVGIAKDILSKNCIVDVERNSKIYFPTKDDVNIAYKNSLKHEIKEYVKKYDELFEKIIMEKI